MEKAHINRSVKRASKALREHLRGSYSMGLNKQKGNMYPWVTHTWNAIKGACVHNCIYCYMKQWGDLAPVHLDNRELQTNLGKGNKIFVGSSCDMWANDIPEQWIQKVISHINTYPDNSYLLQTKNPERMKQFYPSIEVSPHQKILLGITLETNREYDISEAPPPYQRYQSFKEIDTYKMISIEPIIDFDLDIFITWIKEIHPDFVSIGADSKNHHLPEPNKEKIISLMDALKTFTEIKQKHNLERLVI